MDLIDLFIGSEGTLGVISSAELDVQSIPFSAFDGLIFFNSEDEAFSFVDTIKDNKQKGFISPVSLEFLDTNSLKFLSSKYSFAQGTKALVYFQEEVQNEARLESSLDKYKELIENSGALIDKSILADTDSERKKVFEFRHALPLAINEYLREHKQIKVSSDIAVPSQHLNQMYTYYKKIAQESEIDYVNFGHIGEGHLHFNFLPKTSKEYEKAKEYMHLFSQKAISLGGTVSAEHGIGKIKKPYLELMYSKEHLEEMAKLKKYFDPQTLLGLDNIFSKELLTMVK